MRIRLAHLVFILLPFGFAQTAPTAFPLHTYTKSPSAKKRVKPPVGDFTLWVDDTKWEQLQSDIADTLKFSSISGVGWATVMADGVGMTTDDLEMLVLLNEKSIDPDARIILEEKRIVNGCEILALQIAGINKGMPFKHFGYYYGGTSGTVQVITYTIAAAMDDNIGLFTDFLNGLEILDHSSKPTDRLANLASISFNTNMNLKYNPKKWGQMPSNEKGHFKFKYSFGDGYALIVPSPLPIPTDKFPAIALANAQSLGSNASIVFIEDRRVNGVDVLFIKTESTFNGNPVIYCGYYYGGEHDSVQILTYAAKDVLPKYEADFIEFLNGFAVSGHD